MSFASQTDTEQPSTPSTPNTPTTSQPQQPAATNNVSLSGSSNSGAVNLSWNAPGSGSYQYYVFRDGAQIGKGSIITSTGYTDNEAEAGVQYTYYVIAENTSTRETVQSNTISIQN